ncbi:MAG TPA: hypothetical protein VGN81_39695 [Pseudonocardiaceae bacterium]|jgi:hypothetical protein
MTRPAEERLGELLHDLVDDQPFVPDTAAIERAARQAQRRARLTQSGIGVGAVAVVAAVAVGATNLSQPNPVSTGHAGGASTTRPTSSIATNGPLVSLAADVADQPAPTVGDANLVHRGEAANASYGGWDLYTDDGHYYYSYNRADLPKQVREHNDEGDGGFAREVAAALYAVNGNLATARLRMAEAPLDPGNVVAPTPSTFDNRVWDFGMDALIAGSSNPKVRAGVLRLYSTLPEVTVTRTTVEGQPALTLTAAAPALPAGYTETLNINADTGVPLTFHGGEPDQRGVDVTYTSTRVTVTDVAAGKF